VGTFSLQSNFIHTSTLALLNSFCRGQSKTTKGLFDRNVATMSNVISVFAKVYIQVIVRIKFRV